MRKTLIIVENFYSDPEAVREYALGQRYYYPYERNADVRSGRVPANWMASWFTPADRCPFKGSGELIEKLQSVTGEEVDLEHWRLPFPINSEGKAAANCTQLKRKSCLWNCCFHFKPNAAQKIGEGVHNHVTDSWNSVGENGWAGLIYLTPDAPLEGGLKCWRNRDSDKNYDWMTPRENWELVDDLGNVFNRLILCRGNIPHSGAAGWGADIETGRLFQTFFFKTYRSEGTSSLDLVLDEMSIAGGSR